MQIYFSLIWFLYTYDMKKFRYLIFFLCVVMGTAATAAEANSLDEISGVWYLVAAREPSFGSFGEEYFYTAEYGVRSMMVVTTDGNIKIYTDAYDDYFDAEKNEILDARMNMVGDVRFEVRDGYLLLMDDEKNITHVYSKTNPEHWYEGGQNSEGEAYEGKWNLVAEYEPLSGVSNYSWGNNDFFKEQNSFRACLKNHVGEGVDEDIIDSWIVIGDDNDSSMMISAAADKYPGHLEALAENHPRMRVETDGQAADGSIALSFYEMLDKDYLIKFTVSYTEEEWDNGVSETDGAFHFLVDVYERSISDVIARR